MERWGPGRLGTLSKLHSNKVQVNSQFDNSSCIDNLATPSGWQSQHFSAGGSCSCKEETVITPWKWSSKAPAAKLTQCNYGGTSAVQLELLAHSFLGYKWHRVWFHFRSRSWLDVHTSLWGHARPSGWGWPCQWWPCPSQSPAACRGGPEQEVRRQHQQEGRAISSAPWLALLHAAVPYLSISLCANGIELRIIQILQ